MTLHNPHLDTRDLGRQPSVADRVQQQLQALEESWEVRSAEHQRAQAPRPKMRLPLWMLQVAGVALALSMAAPAEAAPVRLKEIVDVKGVRDNALIGYGLVVGLSGTGDSEQVFFTSQSISGMLGRLGVRIDPRQVRVRNVAAVMVTAELPTFARPGGRVDVQVSSIGNARSLAGGTLLLSPLKGPDGKVYVVAQGSVQAGGYVVQSQGSGIQKNQSTAGRIPRGGHVERAVKVDLTKGPLQLSLKSPDFTTAARVATVVNQYYDDNGYFPAPAPPAAPEADAAGEGDKPADAKPADAKPTDVKKDGDSKEGEKAEEPAPQVRAAALDPVAIEVPIPENFPGGAVAFMSAIEALTVDADQKARIVISERTGTVVAGAQVHIRPVVVAHGALKVRIENTPVVSQPGPFASGGTTQVTRQADINANERKAKAKVLPQTTSVQELAAALNLLGASPRDLITILQAMKAAGALDAELEVL